MKFNKLDLLILFISLFIFSACKKENQLGLDEAIGNNGLSGDFTDTLSISAYSVKDDSLIASNFVRNQAGDFNDPAFGNTKAKLAFQVGLSRSNVNFGNNPVLDSIVLVMAYPTDLPLAYYGDTSSVFSIQAHELLEDIHNDSIYYTNRTFNFDAAPIGSSSYKVNTKDSLTIQSIIQGGPDTLIKVAPHIRIKLNHAFGQRLFEMASRNELAENDIFIDKFKGIYLDVIRSSGNGGILSFDLSSSNRSNMILYYKSGSDTGNFMFTVTSASANVNAYSHDYTGTVIEQQLNDTSLGNQNVYIQSLAGVRTRLTFPNLASLNDSGLIAINKATLVLHLEPGSTDEYPASPTLSIRAKFSDNSEATIANANLQNNTYTMDLTNITQRLLNGTVSFEAMYIDDPLRQIRPNRTVLAGAQHPNYRMKLNISYTKLY